MKATELRIGNYVNLRYPITEEGKLTRIGSLTPTGINSLKISEFEPILLDQEWLEKFGFSGWNRAVTLNDSRPQADLFFAIVDGHQKGIRFNAPLYKFDFILDCYLGKEVEPGAFEAHFYYQTNPMKKGREVKYVHELQNLWFTLTGEELAIPTPAAAGLN